MQKIKKALIVLAILGLTLSADAMKRTAEDVGASGGNPFDKHPMRQEEIDVPEFSLSIPVAQLKLKLTQDILVNWPLNTPEKVIMAINYLLKMGPSLTKLMIKDILLKAWVQVDSTKEWGEVIDREVIQRGNRDCADILIDLYVESQKIVPLVLLR